MTLAERFWGRVQRGGEDDCWPWQGGANNEGYGRVRVAGQLVSAHRLAYELTHGPIPQVDLAGNRVCILHTCDTPPCCNPAHLRSGTQGENMAEKEARGRGDKSGLRRGRQW